MRCRGPFVTSRLRVRYRVTDRSGLRIGVLGPEGLDSGTLVPPTARVPPEFLSEVGLRTRWTYSRTWRVGVRGVDTSASLLLGGRVSRRSFICSRSTCPVTVELSKGRTHSWLETMGVLTGYVRSRSCEDRDGVKEGTGLRVGIARHRVDYSGRRAEGVLVGYDLLRGRRNKSSTAVVRTRSEGPRRPSSRRSQESATLMCVSGGDGWRPSGGQTSCVRWTRALYPCRRRWISTTRPLGLYSETLRGGEVDVGVFSPSRPCLRPDRE